MFVPGRIKFLYSLLFILCAPSFASALTCNIVGYNQGYEFVISPVLEFETASVNVTFYAEGAFSCVYSSAGESPSTVAVDTNSMDPVFVFDVKGDSSGVARGYLNCGNSASWAYPVSCSPVLTSSVDASLLYGFGLILGLASVGMILWAALK